MKKKKRLLGILLSLVLVMLFFEPALADTEPTSGDCGNGVSWAYNSSTKTLSFTYSGSGSGVIPDQSKGYFDWASYDTEREIVSFGSGVKVIGANAFNDYGSGYPAKKVYIPDTLTSIGENAFSYCQSLETVTFERAVATSQLSVGEGAFDNASSDATIAYTGTRSTALFDGATEIQAGTKISTIFSNSAKQLTWKNVHAHSFTYAASGATITATCTAAGCTLPPSTDGGSDHVATLTIAANGGTYAGTTAYGATITDANSIQGDAKVQYQKKTNGSYGTATETAPTDAGDYKASITVGGATASVEYTIAQADPTANAPTGLTATYGQTLANVSLEGKNPEGNTPGTWAWANSTQSVGDVVTPAATFKANFTPTSSNYKTVENVDVSVTVSKAANPATVTGTATVIKGGNTVDLANNVTKNGATGDVGYAIDGETKGCTLNGSVLTSGDTTGTVTVNVTVATDDNYNALAATPIIVTISDKGTQKINAADVTVTYGDTDKKVNASVTDPATGGGAISYAVKDGSTDYIDVNATTGALNIKKVPTDGKAYVTVTAAGTAAYEQATKEVTVTINKAAPTVTAPTAKTLTYTGTAQELVNAGSATGGTMWYAVTTENTAPTDDTLYTTSIPAKTDAGT